MARLSNETNIHTQEGIFSFLSGKMLRGAFTEECSEARRHSVFKTAFGVRQSPSSAILSLVNLNSQAHLIHLSVNLFGYHNKSHRLNGLNHRDLFSHFCGVWKSKFKVLAGLILLRPLLDLQRATFLLCLHIGFPYMPLMSVWQNVLFL